MTRNIFWERIAMALLALVVGGSTCFSTAQASFKNKDESIPTHVGTIYHFKKVALKKGKSVKKLRLYTSALTTRYNFVKKNEMFYSTKGADSLGITKGIDWHMGMFYVTNKPKTVKGWVWSGDVVLQNVPKDTFAYYF